MWLWSGSGAFSIREIGKHGCKGNPYATEVYVIEDREAGHVCPAFEGTIKARSIDDAKTKVHSEIEKGNYFPEGFVLSLSEVENSVFSKGSTLEEAKNAVFNKIPSDAVVTSDIKIIQEGQHGNIEVQAFSEKIASQLWQANAPNNAKLEEIECTIPPQMGFLGIGKSEGKWVVKWKINFEVRAFFKSPSEFRVKYIKKRDDSQKDGLN